MAWSWGVRIRGALVNGVLILTIFQDILKCCIVDRFKSNCFCTRSVNPVATVGSAKVNYSNTGRPVLRHQQNREVRKQTCRHCYLFGLLSGGNRFRRSY